MPQLITKDEKIMIEVQKNSLWGWYFLEYNKAIQENFDWYFVGE